MQAPREEPTLKQKFAAFKWLSAQAACEESSGSEHATLLMHELTRFAGLLLDMKQQRDDNNGVAIRLACELQRYCHSDEEAPHAEFIQALLALLEANGVQVVRVNQSGDDCGTE